MHGHWLKGYLRDGKEIEGGGGGSGEGALVVRLTYADADTLVADKTNLEIYEAAFNGPVVFVLPANSDLGTTESVVYLSTAEQLATPTDGTAYSIAYMYSGSTATSYEDFAAPDQYPHFYGGK